MRGGSNPPLGSSVYGMVAKWFKAADCKSAHREFNSHPSLKLRNHMSYKFFQNKSCEYFPCKNVKNLNCLFCFCPLYHLEDCGGNFTILENGLKDCSKCFLPHNKDGYDYIIDKLKQSYL